MVSLQGKPDDGSLITYTCTESEHRSLCRNHVTDLIDRILYIAICAIFSAYRVVSLDSSDIYFSTTPNSWPTTMVSP